MQGVNEDAVQVLIRSKTHPSTMITHLMVMQ